MTTTPIDPKERLIVALDLPDEKQAMAMVEQLGETVVFYKVGLELFLAAGYPVLNRLADLGKKLFLDLKFLDVPQTVRGAVRQLRARLASPPKFITVHAVNGALLQAAVDAQGAMGVLGVTVLTSIPEGSTGTGTLQNLVTSRARLAQEAGCAGIVCAGTDVAAVRRTVGRDLVIVCPGIRPGGLVPDDDQGRISTPAQAIADGANYLVVGRPIRDAKDRLEAAVAIQAEIATAPQLAGESS